MLYTRKEVEIITLRSQLLRLGELFLPLLSSGEIQEHYDTNSVDASREQLAIGVVCVCVCVCYLVT